MAKTPEHKLPTRQVFTSGSGTYTLPTFPSPTYIKVKMVGGGGGGGGGGRQGNVGGHGGTGGNTTFGTSLLVCNGGQGGLADLSNGNTPTLIGGTATINPPATGIAFTGAPAQGGMFASAASVYCLPGVGGSSPFGGAGGGQGYFQGGYGAENAIPNTGSGGGGGSNSGAGGGVEYGGSGGTAGGYIEATIQNPAASYSYSIGAGGTAGSHTEGGPGGIGGSGIIIVDEYYE